MVRDSACAHAVTNRVIGQTFQDVESLQQTFCRGQMEGHLASARVLIMRVDVGATPQADREVERNQALLEVGLSRMPALVRVVGSAGGREDDGWIDWQGALRVVPRDNSAQEQASAVGLTELVLPALRAPLEIGFTLPSRTWWHLEEDGAVWRWPDGSNELTLLVSVARGREGWMVTTLGHGAELREGRKAQG